MACTSAGVGGLNGGGQLAAFGGSAAMDRPVNKASAMAGTAFRGQRERFRLGMGMAATRA
jgi:hypothetical protein